MEPSRNRLRPLRMIIGLLAIVILSTAWTEATVPRKGPHGALELALLRSQIQGLDVQFGTYFVTAGRCSGCHGHDSLGIAMVAEDGTDVNVTDDWRSTMMANSGRDPFFLAKIEHEGLVNPQHKAMIEHKCLKCHAPLAVFEEEKLGHPPFTMAHMDTSVFARDGVSCLACHMQNPTSAGHSFSGELHFDSARVWGPYTSEQINPAIMEFFVGYTPDQGAHMLDGRVCAGCHTLITETTDFAGNFTGQEFVEQATWQEYKNSVFFGSQQTCVSCHLPSIQDSVRLASEYIFLPGQSPYGKHHLAGGNAFMLRMLRDHINTLNIPATATQFDNTIARSLHNLANSVQLSTTLMDRTSDTAFVAVQLTNIIGHKFPSGYPSRRAFIRVVATTANGDTLFQSGRWDGTNEVIGHDPDYEPHYDVITRGDQVQIYELVMGDVNGNVTTTLERAAFPLKDNRLVPAGFSTTHASYDTVAIVGVDPSDSDFNHDALGVEGNGGDIVHYHMATGGYEGPIQVHTSIWYQPVPPKWNDEMFGHHGPAIDRFRSMYQQADGTPDLVARDSLLILSTGVGSLSSNDLCVFPNPTTDGRFKVLGKDISELSAYDAAGKRAPLRMERGNGYWLCTLPEQAGTYHLVVTTPEGQRLLRIVRTGK